VVSRIISSAEEPPMTMQVGMVGTDGIVLAGDTRRTKSPVVKFGQERFSGRYGENGTKIKIRDDRKIAVSSALCLDTAERIAGAIIARQDISNAGLVESGIETIAKEVFGANKKKGFHCIVVVSVDPKPRLYLVTDVKVGRSWTAICLEKKRLAVAGDTVNAAVFWAERYYNQYLHIEKKPVTELIPLAAHLIVCAHSLNTATVSGLEIVVCKSSGVELQSEDFIDQLENRAAKREEAIAKMIFNDE
jgi:hypothetical protein